jgi:hypothetical protein
VSKTIKILGGLASSYVAANLVFGGIEAMRTAKEPCGSFTYPLDAWVTNSVFSENEKGVRNRLGLLPLGFGMMGSMIGDGVGEAIRRCPDTFPARPGKQDVASPGTALDRKLPAQA